MEGQVIPSIAASVIEAAYLAGFEPSQDGIQMMQLFVEAEKFLLGLV